jgi:tripartite-type tricarboxylate transporter receptor subunit TctC
MSKSPIVMVVDDDAGVRNAMRALLKSVGIGAALYSSAQEFLAAYDPQQPGCLLLDIRMPGMSGMELQHVPYKSTGPNITDLIAGRTQATSAGTPPLLPHVKSGKLRVIAVGTSKRLQSIPEVATVAEQGYPGFETSQWYGLQAPAGTPEPIIRRLSEEAAKAAKSPLVRERFKPDDAEPVGSTPREYAAFIKKEQERWSKVVRAAHIKAD